VDLANPRRRVGCGHAWEDSLINCPNPEHVPECEA